MLPDSFKLSDLCCGHEGKYICSLKGRFDLQLVNEPIQLGQLSCGCWIVLDGNNRIGLILKHDVEAKIGEFPKKIFTFLKNEEFAEEEIYYWTPYPKTFGYILPLSKQLNILKRNKKSFKSEADYQKEVNKITSLLTKKMHECPVCSIPGLTAHVNRNNKIGEAEGGKPAAAQLRR
jgi:hypothetical protein